MGEVARVGLLGHVGLLRLALVRHLGLLRLFGLRLLRLVSLLRLVCLRLVSLLGLRCRGLLFLLLGGLLRLLRCLFGLRLSLGPDGPQLGADPREAGPKVVDLPGEPEEHIPIGGHGDQHAA
ncbi:hypothetical protein [Amycolatopsis sp. MJM2582]|uniref:hypothetical protein n=1 Tax=Amycolatopsis sp. MJM2582 TaxID=1427749 RepID=UPI001F2ED148|nr:hypothetical protein [Amycolatopsis sp. MJM2582]